MDFEVWFYSPITWLLLIVVVGMSIPLVGAAIKGDQWVAEFKDKIWRLLKRAIPKDRSE